MTGRRTRASTQQAEGGAVVERRTFLALVPGSRRLPLLLRQFEIVRTLLIASATRNFLRLPVFRGDR